MKKDSLEVYERPEAEEVKLVVESNILSNVENPDDPCKTDDVCAFHNQRNYRP